MHRILFNISGKVCQRMMKDVMIRKELEKQFPNMFMEIHYEDIAANPIEMTNRIYQFAFSKDAPDHVINWVTRYTVLEEEAKAEHNLHRDSMATSTAWRADLNTEQINIIGKQCKHLLAYLNL